MSKGNNFSKKEIVPIILMALLFVIIHSLALVLTTPFEDAGMEAFEDPDEPMNIAFIIVIMLVFTLLILLIAKFWKKQVIQLVILGAIGYTAFYVLYPLFNLVFGDLYFRVLELDPGSYLIVGPSEILAAITALTIVYILIKHPEWYVIDLTGVIIGTGAIAIFGISLGVTLVLILLIILAIYDAISVYKTKHMVDLADTVMDLKLPVLMVIPKVRNYSLIKETKRLKEKLKEGEERDAFFMGLGDIVMPGILVVAIYASIPNALPISLGTMIGTLVGFAVLMTFVIKGKPQAGLPCLNGGAIAGYVISSLIIKGNIVGLTIPF